jgi:hypothetical protein
MKKLKAFFLLFVFTLIGFVSAEAQRVESDSELIGKWDLTIMMEKGAI